MAMNLQAYQLVLLRRADEANDLDQAAIDRIQREHLAFYDDQREAKTVVSNGPVLDQPDERLRGIAFFNVGSIDRARELAETDPAVQAGRLSVEVMTWWCPLDSMTQPGSPVTIPD